MQALTFSSYINAWTLCYAGKKLDVVVRTTDNNPLFSIVKGRTDGSEQWLLFTEEDSLGKALRGELRGHFHPRCYPLELLDDKWAFSEWLERQADLEKSLHHSTLTYTGSLMFPLLLKAKHSWHKGRKLPRGWVCRDRSDLIRCQERLVSDGFHSECFFLQEWLGDEPMRLLSVCGFFDVTQPERNLTCVVERLASYETGPSCSAIVATVKDEWNLTEKAFSILQQLEFVGPFEIEFIVTRDRMVVLEINPRFWMQHALFLVDGNGLLKRYFGLDTELDRHQKTIGKLLWIDGLFLFSNLAKLKFGLLKIMLKKYQEGYQLLVWPPVPVTLEVLTKKLFYKIFEGQSHQHDN